MTSAPGVYQNKFCIYHKTETFRGFPGILDESSPGSAAVQGSSLSLQENKHNKSPPVS